MRTRGELQQRIDDDLVWRRRELSYILSAIQDAGGNEPKQTTLLRAGVTLLYAHWEGFIKRCGTLYLQFVGNQGKKASELKSNFIAIRLKAQLLEATKSKKTSSANELVTFFRENLDAKLRLPYKGIIDTQSNLSSTIFFEILEILGLDKSSYETKKNLIDKRLVDNRNHIAHGEPLTITAGDYQDLHESVVALLDEFRTQVQNASVRNEFLV